MKILITGAAGYIGSHLLKHLTEHDVHTLDITHLKDNNFPTKLYDIRSPFNEPTEYDCVIHLAALVQVGESVNNPIDYYETNVCGTLNTLKGIKCNHFIFASTGAAEMMDSPYSISKVASEQIVKQYCTEHEINYTIFRFYNVIGNDPGLYPTNPDGLFYALRKSLVTGEFSVYGTDYDTLDGTCVRDYVHVNEICNAIKTAVSKPANNIESLGHGKGTSVMELVNLFKKVNGVNININMLDRREGDTVVSVLENVSSYMEELYTMEEMVKI